MLKKARVFKIETFGAVDGPGIRLVIFFQGCNFHCQYCHNPESWPRQTENTFSLSIRKIIKLYQKNKAFYINGGITISGGEPMLQFSFLYSLAKVCKRKHIHLAIDTAAVNFSTHFDWYKKISKYVDLWLIDIKALNVIDHQKITGCNQLTGMNLISLLEKLHQSYWVRYVLVNGLTDSNQQINNLASFLKTLQYMKRFDLLPYHNLALEKYKKLNLPYSLIKTPILSKQDNLKILAMLK